MFFSRAGRARLCALVHVSAQVHVCGRAAIKMRQTCINREEFQFDQAVWWCVCVCVCVRSRCRQCACMLVLCFICISTSHRVAKTTSSVHLGGQEVKQWCKHTPI